MPEETQPTSRPRRRRRVLKILIALAVVVVVLIAAAPMIAGRFAPGIVQDAMKGSINGKTRVESVSLSWFGGQKIGPIVVQDDAGRDVASLKIEASKGLLSLGRAAMGALDLGQVRISGNVTVVRNADGSTNVERLFAKAAAPTAPASPGSGAGASKPVQLPAGLAADIRVETLGLRIVDSKGASLAEVKDLKAQASLSGGKVKLTLTAPMAAATAAKGGNLTVDALIDHLCDSSGKFTPDAATIDAQVDAKDIPVALADALAGMDNKLVAAIGETLQLSVSAKGTMNEGDATVTVASKGITSDFAIKSSGGVVTNTKPMTIALATSGMLPLSPALEKALRSGSDAKVDKLPDTTITIDSLRLPIRGGFADLRTASALIDVQATETSGSVAAEPGGKARAFRIAPVSARVDARELSKGVHLTAATAATLDGTSAGSLSVDVTATDVLDANGGVRTKELPRFAGQASLTGFVTAIAQPFLESAGVDVGKDVGPKLDLVFKAASESGGGSVPPTHLSVDVVSANVNAIARFLLNEKAITTEDRGVEVKIGSLSRLASQMAPGVAVESGLGATLTVTGVSLGTGGGSPDPRTIRGTVNLATTAASGKITAAGQPAQAFQLAPLTAVIDAKDLTQGVQLKVGTSATLGGAPAGTVDMDVMTSALAAGDGSWASGVPSIRGRVLVSGVATAVVQPWLSGTGIDLPAGIGPKLDIAVTAAPSANATASNGVPPTDLDVKITSANLNGTAAASIDGKAFRTRAGGLDFTLASPGALMPPVGGQKLVGPGGTLRTLVKNAIVSLDGKSPLESATADVEVQVAGLSVTQAGSPPVALESLIVKGALKPGTKPRLDIDGKGSHAGAPFSAKGSMEIAGLTGAFDPANIRPAGTITLSNIPTSLAAIISPAPPKPGERTLAMWLRDGVGPSINVVLAAAERKGDARASDVVVTLTSDRTKGEIACGFDDRQLSLSKLNFTGTISPELAAAAFDTIGTGLDSKPALTGPASVILAADPFVVPIRGSKLDLAGAGEVSLRAGLEGTTLINNIVFKEADGKRRDVGVVGLQDLVAKLKVPLASLAPGGPRKSATVDITGAILGTPEKKAADLKCAVKTDLSGGSPIGDVVASVELAVLDAARLDSILNKPGFVTGAVGETLTVTGNAIAKYPEAGAKTFDTAKLDVAIKSPRVTTSQPLKMTASSDRIAIDSPMVLTWQIDPAWANRYALGAASSGTPGAPQDGLRLTKAAQFTVSLSSLVIARGEAPMKPGVFAMDAQIAAPEVALASGAAPLVVKKFAARTMGGHEPGTIGFSIRADDLGSGPPPAPPAPPAPAVPPSPAPSTKPAATPLVPPAPTTSPAPPALALLFQGGLYRVSDAAGKPTPDAAVLTMTGDATAFPTAILDALAQQKGMLIEALGNAVTVKMETKGANKTRGDLAIKAVSPRAEANLKGFIQGGVFVSQEQLEVTLKEVTPELSRRMLRGLPMISMLEKRPEDGPTKVRAANLKAPIDGQVQKLFGDVTIDIGQARFETSKAFGTILRVAKQKDSGVIDRVEPLVMNIKDGIAIYQKWHLPLGEFILETRGTVDLVNQRLDVITYVPFGALSDSASRALGGGRLLGNAALKQATMVPFRTQGTFDNNKTELDMELFIKETGNSLLSPDGLLKDGLKDLFKK